MFNFHSCLRASIGAILLAWHIFLWPGMLLVFPPLLAMPAISDISVEARSLCQTLSEHAVLILDIITPSLY